jgi:predicted metal-dependent hydrolase
MCAKAISKKQRELQVGAQKIAYTLVHTNRKSVGITVRPNLSVEVRAPLGSSQEFIDEIMRKRATWITGHLQKFATRPAVQSPSSKPQGDTYQLLGRPIPLKVLSTAGAVSKREEVKLEKSTLYVRTRDSGDKRRIEALLERWSREQAESFFFQRMLALLPRFKGAIRGFPGLTIRRMKARWGSCSSSGAITLNLKLIHLDEALIDYVIVHELCHLIEHNHGKHFYALLTRIMPDWQEYRQRLNELGMPE